jgi:ribose 5-phosphate isomerase B
VRRTAAEVRISVGGDHAGYPLKVVLIDHLREQGHEVLDMGTDSEEAVDYPPFVAAAARAVAEGHAERGIVLGGSGQGEQIVANKIEGIRAALCNDLYVTKLSRRHNDANVLAMGARIVAPALALELVETWLVEPFDGGRHARRIEQITEIERGER